MNKPNKLPLKSAQTVAHFAAKNIKGVRPSDTTTITITSLNTSHMQLN